jgi:hypothetical protein
MKRVNGISKRIRGRLHDLGYWKDGRPDVYRFCLENRYLPQSLYAWLKDRIPTPETLIRLGMDLGVPPAWLLFGDNPPEGWAAAEVRQFLRAAEGSSAEQTTLTARIGG